LDPSLDMWDLSSPLISLWINRFYIYLGFAFGISLWICVQIVIKKQDRNSQEKSVPKTTQDLMTNGYISLEKEKIFVSGVKIFYGSQTGTAKVRTLYDAFPLKNFGLLQSSPKTSSLKDCVFSSSVFFLQVGKNVDKWLWMLGAHRVMTRGEGDCDVVRSKHGSIEADFRAWKTKFIYQLQALCKGEKKKSCGGNCKKGKCESNQHGSEETEPGSHTPDEFHPRDTEEEEPCESTSEEEFGSEDRQGLNSVVDVEDLGKIMDRMKKEKKEKEQQEEKTSLFRNTGKNEDGERRAMITPALREALTKQGYQLIGSHSGVKLCRWTKSMLRGRGGCYKHTFYGIESHRCMETTPSLACANKCVFCWRHHTNPVGTEWRWKMDQPEMILKEAIENHQNMIKQFKGVPGVQAERFEEGMTVKHCALSLVGEPIMYPEINRFLKLLHHCKISSFLVTNQQRTVYRLTLVKAWNVDELQAYAQLVSLGNPDFIEVKGVTYCGESSASSLTMANVPWHEEVVRFVQELAELIPDYEIACEHEHSNCLLIAHKKFKIDGEWWTWIDYNRFQELVQEYEDSGGSKTFSAKEYMAKTPHWALFGAHERGFDPKDTRYQRKNRSKDISGC
uniref:tRNA wybutosine-synthesis domain-containing protein n=1 Tax=Propithecus coquereli TaxID=379532 RepID=A0A2K6F240_PROCO